MHVLAFGEYCLTDSEGKQIVKDYLVKMDQNKRAPDPLDSNIE